jgi:uncharacterized membrane protein
MQMIDNYLNSLESYLPDELKKDIRDEFEASIYDQIEERQEELNRDLTQKEQEQLLVKIGHPMQVAARYLPNQKLIGESYFPAYKKSLKLAILILFSIKILLTLPSILTDGNVILSVFVMFWGLINTALWAFAYVTIIFYLMERFSFDVNYLYSFSAKDLQANSPKLSLSRIETVFELVILLLFIAWWNNIFNWTILGNTTITIINVSMSSEWQAVFWSVNLIVGLDIAVCLYNIFKGSYTRLSLIFGSILNIASIVILIQISRFSNYVNFNDSKKVDLNWEKIEPLINFSINILIVVIIAVNLWELYLSAKKLRYFNSNL